MEFDSTSYLLHNDSLGRSARFKVYEIDHVVVTNGPSERIQAGTSKNYTRSEARELYNKLLNEGWK